MIWDDRALYTSECSPTGRKFNRFWSTRSDWNRQNVIKTGDTASVCVNTHGSDLGDVSACVRTVKLIDNILSTVLQLLKWDELIDRILAVRQKAWVFVETRCTVGYKCFTESAVKGKRRVEPASFHNLLWRIKVLFRPSQWKSGKLYLIYVLFESVGSYDESARQ